jgi:pantothenate synthetase
MYTVIKKDGSATAKALAELSPKERERAVKLYPTAKAAEQAARREQKKLWRTIRT